MQDIWFAKKIIKAHPDIHYDIGSRVDGFISHLLAAEINVNMIDIRPLPIIVGVSFTQGDATSLTNIEENSISSLSSLHVVEHFGLGRYGDRIDPKGWIKGLEAMQRIVKKGGYLYLSLPTSNTNRLYFNAHRVIEFHEAPKVLDKMKLTEVAYISNYKLIEISMDEFDECVIDDDYGCACYVFRKV